MKKQDSRRRPIPSDVNVPDVCRSAREIHVLLHALAFCGDALLLCLPQTGLQQRFDLLLARSKAILWKEPEAFSISWKLGTETRCLEKGVRKSWTYWVTPDNLGQVVGEVLGG